MFFSCFWDHCSLLIDKLFVQNSLEPCSSISGAFLPPLGALVHIAPYALGTHNHSTKRGGLATLRGLVFNYRLHINNYDEGRNIKGDSTKEIEAIYLSLLFNFEGIIEKDFL